MSDSNLLVELSRRGMFRIAGAYLVSAWAIAKMAELGLEKFDAPAWGMQATLIVLLIGFPIVLVLAWMHDLGTVSLDLDIGEGVDSAGGRVVKPVGDDAATAAPGKHGSAYRIMAISATLAVLALASWVFQQESGPADQQLVQSRKSIAVLPFANLSGQQEDEFFSDGVSEELLNLLARIPELRVISRSSAFSYKGKGLDAPTIARELNVDHILEGSVRKLGDQVRINAQLVDAGKDTQLWTETFDRRLDDVFAAQDEIAAAVIQQLKLVLLGAAPTSQQVDATAYTLFLQGRHLSRLGSSNAIQLGIEKFQSALAIDPNFSEAWSELGLNQIRQARLPNVSEAEAFAEAFHSLNLAVQANAENATAHSRLGWLAMSGNELQLAADQLSLALQQQPGNVSVLVNAGQLMSQLGRHDDARELFERATSVDPTSASVHWNYSESLWAAGELEQARQQVELAIGFGPDYLGVNYTRGILHLQKGEFDAAMAAFGTEGSAQLSETGTAMALHSLGRQAEFDAALTDAAARWGEERPSEIAAVYLWAGDLDAGFEWLQRAWRARDRRLFLVLMNPVSEPARADPRWAEFLLQIGRAPEQLAAIRFEL